MTLEISDGEKYLQTEIQIPLRSYLYPLKPFALGTNYVESLTSYITALATIHRVPTGVLLAQELALSFKNFHPSLSLSSKFYYTFFLQKGSWNGTGIMAADLVFILQKLTHQPTLRFLTLLTWANVLPTRNLFRGYKAWCPLCYFEWEQNGIPIHEPLLWSFSIVTVCLKHRQPLLSQCPNCDNTINYLSWNSKLGFCCRCQNWLGISCSLSNRPTITENDWTWQTFIQEQIGDILAAAPYIIYMPKREYLAVGIHQCILNYFNGNSQEFAAKMFLSSTVPLDWVHGNAIPELNLILRVCYCLSISLLDFFTGNVTILESKFIKDLPLSQQQRKVNRPFDPNQIQQLLEATLSEFPPKSVSQIAEAIKYHPSDLYRNFPLLCRQISTRYKLYRKSSTL